MGRFYPISLLLCFLMVCQVAWADEDPNVIVFQETFDQNNGTGGRDDKYDGQIASSNIVYDNTGWTQSYVYGGKQCLRFGSSNNVGSCTTPDIMLSGATHALLTFSAAGWGDSKKNTLTITANDGVTLSGDCNITELVNEEWNDYSVLITMGSATSLQLTFTGKRGFLDDVVVRTITTVPAPTLPDEFMFWPQTTEENAEKLITLIPVSYTTVRYTTDNTEPSPTNGTVATMTTNIPIHGTTTVKAIAYVDQMTSSVVTKTYTQGMTVNGIATFKELAEDSEARLYIADDADARVLHGHDGKQMYLRDNSGTICFDFGTTATFNPAPEHNQHVAGWIVGKKQTVDNLTKLVATENTNTNYLALAAPVTEADTEPTEVYSDEGDYFDLYNYVGDWVKVNEARTDADVTIENTFGTENVANTFVYRQLVDVSGIVLSNTGSMTKVAPVAYNNIKPVVYVINEDKIFVGPSQDIQHATIRLKRTLSKDYWNTFVVPFNIFSLDGEIREYNELNGSTMHFDRTDQMMAGVPYLVKPNEDIVDPVFSDVTLSATAPAFVDRGGDYYFVGTYSPKELETDKTELFLTTAGRLAYPQNEGSSQIKGMRAYFKIPEGAEAMTLTIEGDSDSMGIYAIENGQLIRSNEVYDLQGRKVKQPTKGLYIVNGKKIIIQ